MGIFLFLNGLNGDPATAPFYVWIVKDFIPKSLENSVLVVDGTSFHKHNDIRGAIEKAGHILEFLPAYSPDLNPIEQKWAQVKAIRK